MPLEKSTLLFENLVNYSLVIGDWRNWLARTDGVREAAGSNPVSPTNVLCVLSEKPEKWKGLCREYRSKSSGKA